MRTGLHRHYSGKLYQVLSVGRHSETLEEMVIYQALYGDYGFWCRPKIMFEEEISVDGVTQPRFAFVTDHRSTAPQLRD